MSKVKTGLFALLGRLVWTLLARVGVPLAKRKLQQRRGPDAGEPARRAARRAA